MKIEKAIKRLMQEYEKARNLEYVRNPVAYAMYHVWKEADTDDKPKPNPLCQISNGVTFATDTNDGCKWISVEERLPEPGVIVLVHSKLGCTYFSHRLYYHLEGRPFSIEYSGGWEVTHWMPLPKPPLNTTNQAADL